MDYTLSTFLPECSLSQEPKTRQEIEKNIGMEPSGTSMPLLMHLINSVKNGAAAKAPLSNNLVDPIEPNKEEKPDTENLLWDNNNMDIKQQLEDQDAKKSPGMASPAESASKLSSLDGLPSLGQKKSSLEPLDFNPKESPKADHFGESIDREKKSLNEVDKKLKEFENDGLKMEMDRDSPDRDALRFGSEEAKPKPAGGLDDYEDDFEDDIEEDLPVEDFDPAESPDKNPEFHESGMSGSQSMGMDPSVQSLDVEDYDHIEKAMINSPYK
eukprot:CAMPEP_0197003670 /NCGR_PEP_ID=MMETSP1380-20130617/11218_1 /TAXON_ID=5936 /ORGANISM="Euplotes crassus, Strain CT5" /LENGTH=269 /DNA_ID=CAMNT_0042422241 /DNA_START=243 /DNA_END=1053 /DNA_ORIENTATION=+